MSFILPYGGWGFLRGEEYFEIGISGCGVTETVVVGSKGGGVCSEGGGARASHSKDQRNDECCC